MRVLIFIEFVEITMTGLVNLEFEKSIWLNANPLRVFVPKIFFKSGKFKLM